MELNARHVYHQHEIFIFKELSELDNSGNLANKMAEILMDQGPMVVFFFLLKVLLF